MVRRAGRQAGRQDGRQAGWQAGKINIKAQAVAVHRVRHWRESTYILHGPSPSIMTPSPSIIAIVVVVSIMAISQVASDNGDNDDDGHQDHDGDEGGATRKIDRIHAPPKARSKETNSESVI